MKLTKSYLTKLILEEVKLSELEAPLPPTEEEVVPGATKEEPSAEEDPKVQDLRQKLLDVSKTMTGVQANEVEMVNFFIELIDLAKRENINVGEFKRRVGLVQQAAQKLA